VTEIRSCEGKSVENKVIFLRKRDKDGMTFGFPDRVDISWITPEQIVQKLLQPKMHGHGRCLLKFDCPVDVACD